MNTEQIAEKLASYCREAKWKEAQQKLYANDAVSIEPHETPMFAKETRGLDAIFEKGKTFEGITEAMHSVEVSTPLVAGNAFTFRLEMDMTAKGQGRSKMSELCVYETKDGKIVSEQFFM